MGYHNRLLLGHVWELASIFAKRRITRCIESQDSHYTILFFFSLRAFLSGVGVALAGSVQSNGIRALAER